MGRSKRTEMPRKNPCTQQDIPKNQRIGNLHIFGEARADSQTSHRDVSTPPVDPGIRQVNRQPDCSLVIVFFASRLPVLILFTME